MKQKSIYRTPAGEQAVAAYYNRILAEWPESTESLHLKTRHGRTHVLARGRKDACPLVLLHGAGANALAWGGDVAEFARRFRVYAVETTGDPGRSCQARISWHGEGIIEWLEDVLDGLDVKRALLAGISQGGYISLRFAVARPDRVRALAVLAPAGVSPVKPGFLVRGLTYRMFGRRGSDSIVRHVMNGSEVPAVAAEFMNLTYKHFRSRLDAQPLLADAELRTLTMPVLLMAGAKDAIFDSTRTAARFERLVKGADIRLLPQAGHALIDVAEEIMPFLVKAATERGPSLHL